MAKTMLQILCIVAVLGNTLAFNICEFKANGERVAHPIDCAQFLVCEGSDVAYVKTCPSGLHFNRNIGECDLKKNAGCEESNFWAAANTCDTSTCCACCDCSGCPKCDNDLTVCEGQPDNSLQQFPGNCSQYIVCNSNCATIRSCPSGQLWNPQTRKCDKACNVNCPGSGYPCQPQCSNDLTVCNGKPDNSLQAYPGDCSKYVTCDKGCAVIKSCPRNQLWNPTTQACDKACNVDCPGSGYPCQPQCSNDLTVCNGKPDNSLQAYPGDCSKYVTCDKGCAVIKSCPRNQLWNPTTQTCDKACNVDCPGSGYPCQPQCSNDLTVCNGKPDNSLQAIPGDCTQYATCQNGCAILTKCPVQQLWNPATNTCDDACSVNCPNNPYPCSNSCPEGLDVCIGKPPGSIQAYPGDCQIYVICNENCDIVKCPNGELWNPSKQRCDTACNVDCPGSGYPCTQPPTGPSGVSCDNSGICRDRPDGTLFKDSNSNGYIVCQCECEIPRPCPPGLIFNEDLLTCDWPRAS